MPNDEQTYIKAFAVQNTVFRQVDASERSEKLATVSVCESF